MENDKLIAQLRSVSVETGSLVCLGCGHENNCGIHGCAILRAAVDCMEGLVAQLAERDKQISDLETQHRMEHCECTGYDCEVRGLMAAALQREMAMRDCVKNIEDAVSRGKLAIWGGLFDCKYHDGAQCPDYVPREKEADHE